MGMKPVRNPVMNSPRPQWMNFQLSAVGVTAAWPSIAMAALLIPTSHFHEGLPSARRLVKLGHRGAASVSEPDPAIREYPQVGPGLFLRQRAGVRKGT